MFPCRFLTSLRLSPWPSCFPFASCIPMSIPLVSPHVGLFCPLRCPTSCTGPLHAPSCAPWLRETHTRVPSGSLQPHAAAAAAARTWRSAPHPLRYASVHRPARDRCATIHHHLRPQGVKSVHICRGQEGRACWGRWSGWVGEGGRGKGEGGRITGRWGLININDTGHIEN